MDKVEDIKKNKKQDEEHVIFIDRLCDDHIQKDKKNINNKSVNKNKKSR